ncbi:MAG: Ig-like domain-containing protein, partial [Gammaproteobacteria bacterium]|nr:Ig-like domain-containing protein [Gammaproteobacteria bacterium]
NVPEKTGAEGFDFFGGIELTLPEDIYAEKEIGLSVPIPDGSDILPEDRILLFKEIEFSGRTGVMLVNTAHVNSEEGRIETASPPFPGARSKGRYMFFKPLYPDKMVVVTPSPTFGVGLVGMQSQDFGDIFAEMLYYKTAPICLIPENRPFSVTVCEPDEDGETPADCTTGSFTHEVLENPEADFSTLHVGKVGEDGPVTAWDTWPADGAEDVPSDIVISVEFDTPPTPASVTGGLILKMTGCEGFSPGTENVPAEVLTREEYEETDSSGQKRRYVIKPVRPLMYNAEYKIGAAGIMGYITDGTAGTEPFGGTAVFKTVKVKQTDSVAVEHPYDVRVLSSCRLAVANGSATSDFDNDGHGIVLIDISDTEKLSVLSEKKSPAAHSERMRLSVRTLPRPTDWPL